MKALKEGVWRALAAVPGSPKILLSSERPLSVSTSSILLFFSRSHAPAEANQDAAGRDKEFPGSDGQCLFSPTELFFPLFFTCFSRFSAAGGQGPRRDNGGRFRTILLHLPATPR